MNVSRQNTMTYATVTLRRNRKRINVCPAQPAATATCVKATCYWGAISRVEHQDGSYEYVVDDEKCIGCGFCAGICPCGVWEMVENV